MYCWLTQWPNLTIVYDFIIVYIIFLFTQINTFNLIKLQNLIAYFSLIAEQLKQFEPINLYFIQYLIFQLCPFRLPKLYTKIIYTKILLEYHFNSKNILSSFSDYSPNKFSSNLVSTDWIIEINTFNFKANTTKSILVS